MATRMHRTVAADGTPIACRTSGEGESLLLVHSAAADARQWARLAPILARRFAVTAMDRRGRGTSGPLRPGHSLEVDYGDVAAVANALDAPVHLFGHSSGARYALHAAARVPALASLMLYEPPAPETLPEATLRSLEQLEAAGDREGVLRTFLVDAAGNSEAAFASLRQRPIWPLMLDNALTLPAELRAAARYRFDPTAVAGLAVPTLLLVGEESGPELRRVAHQVAAALPHATVRTLAGQGHGAMFSAPDLLASEVERFIASVAG